MTNSKILPYTNSDFAVNYAFGFIDRIEITPITPDTAAYPTVVFGDRKWLGTHYGLVSTEKFVVTRIPHGTGVSWVEYRPFPAVVSEAVYTLAERALVAPTLEYVPQAYIAVEDCAALLLEFTQAEFTPEQAELATAITNELELNAIRYPYGDNRRLLSDTAVRGLLTLTKLVGITPPAIYTDTLTQNVNGAAVFDPQAFFAELCSYLEDLSWESYLRKYSDDSGCVVIPWSHAEIRIYFNTEQDTVLILDKERECFVQAEADNLAFEFDAGGHGLNYLTYSIDNPIPDAEFNYLAEQQANGPQACSTDAYSVVLNPFIPVGDVE